MAEAEPLIAAAAADMEATASALPPPAGLDAAWQRVVDEVMRRKAVLGAVLQHATPLRVEGGVLTLALLASRFHREMLNDRGSKDLIDQAVRRHVRRRGVRAGSHGGATSGGGGGARNHPAVQAALSAFQGEVVAVRPRSPEEGEPVKGFGNMMKEAQKLQAQMEQLQAEAAKKKVEATAGGGMVTVEANGKQEIVSIKIDREVINRRTRRCSRISCWPPATRRCASRRRWSRGRWARSRPGSRSPASAQDRKIMAYYPEPVARLIDALQRLPGIGPKTAQRLTFFLLKRPAAEVAELGEALAQLKERIVHCSTCFNVTEQDPCRICEDPQRDQRTLCVVEEPNDLLALERTGEFRGRYHVLLGALSPLDGIGPEDLKVRELLVRLEDDQVEEVILATNPNVEGEATALYLARLLRPLGMRITRIARGLPVGGDLEYADQVTLSKALEGRREMG